MGKYWDLYYQRTDALMETYPDAFSLHDMRDLNSREEREKILSFLGYTSDKMVVSNTYRKNTRVGRGAEAGVISLWGRALRMMRNMMPTS